ncbi:hypothetical protein MKW92_007755 [Papaver armeniacum]|nr:hypothetical protein MKW92_007755 [Papaver armeniacum]
MERLCGEKPLISDVAQGNTFQTPRKSNSRFFYLSTFDLDKTPTVPQHLYVSETSEIGDNSIDVSVSLDEFMRQWVMGLTKEISRTNTQFHGKLIDSGPRDDTIAVMYTPTPSPAPGVDDSPFITWGEIEGTPLRLETEDTPVGIGDVKAHSLSRETARKLRERSKMFQKPLLPSPARGGSANPGVRTLSHAAQKFVRNVIAKSSSSMDGSLRASYRGSSPAAVTPKSGRSSTRLGTDSILGSRSPSVRDGSNPVRDGSNDPPW